MTAVVEDREPIIGLLKKCRLPNDDIGSLNLDHFILAKNEHQIVGVIGLEICGPSGLIRSMAVEPQQRGKGIARALYLKLIGHAKELGIQNLYLLTNTAESFFKQQGFNKIERGKLPNAIQATREFQSLCPESAIAMFFGLGS